MINNWRLTSDVVFMIENAGGGNHVYIASPEKKQYEAAVAKLAKNVFSTETIENSEFEIKIGSFDTDIYTPRIYIRTSQIPELGWAKIANFYIPSIWNIISQSKIDCGKLAGKFKIMFTDSDPTKISLVSSNMDEYNDAFEEMKRRLRCEIGKKTKKLKPGHRYDLLKETRYYLCDVVSRKDNMLNSDFLSDGLTKSTKAYIYTNRVLDSDKNISDVLNNRKFGPGLYDLKISIEESTSWVDSGEKLDNDFTGNIKDYWESIVDKTIQSEKTKLSDSNYYIYPNISDIFGILGCQSETDIDYKISDSLNNRLREVIFTTLQYNFLKNWKLKVYEPSIEISDKKEIEANVQSLCKLFYESIEDGNIHKFQYYSSLFSRLGIDLEKISESIIVSFSESDITCDFDSFQKYRFYWKNKKSIYSTSKPILDFTIDKLKDSPDELDNIFGRSDLSRTIRDLYNYADSNYGSGVNEYKVFYRNKKDSELAVFCYITLDDIMKFKKGVSGMSDSLKNDIILNKFNSVVIKCKKSDTL